MKKLNLIYFSFNNELRKERERERERERGSVRERKRKREREGKKPLSTWREIELQISSKMRFNSSTFSYLALIVIKSNRETEKSKKFKKGSRFRSEKKNFKNNRNFNKNLATIRDINIFRTISSSQKTSQYPYFKP